MYGTYLFSAVQTQLFTTVRLFCETILTVANWMMIKLNMMIS